MTAAAARPFVLAAIAPQPWRNGGGATREILCAPSADGEGWDWRVSVAEIEQPGAFSVFAGVDRTALLLDGAGLALHGSAPQPPLVFAAAGCVHRFAGETALAARLGGGPARLFNVMTRRSRASAVLGTHTGDGALDLGDAAATVLFVTRGRFALTLDAAAGYRLQAGHGLCLDGDSAQPVRHACLQALQPDASLIQVSFHRH
ncbi:HutD family protein [Azoarcus olearius]|uniref:HutD family protein n=1 Tax=Azoarcus sp. (strain BH72) TaxID=418699 RepID=A1K9W8_AZOSB|nr:HutD family protein [Azoarcus olearius]CAL95623.1 conserved hypothetical protein [Azoarcus olearius]